MSSFQVKSNRHISDAMAGGHLMHHHNPSKLIIISIIILINLIPCVVSMQSPVEATIPHHGRCEKITIDLCKDIMYNETIMPNLLNHAKQEEAGLEIHLFAPLVKVQCSPDLQFFLCTMYAPVCTILEKAIPPCRSLCESARRDCEGVIKKFGYRWPDNLDCSRLPEYTENNLCVGEDSSRKGNVHTSNSDPSFTHTSNTGHYGTNFNLQNVHNINNAFSNQPARSQIRNNVSRDLPFKCPLQFRTPFGLDYHLKIRGMDRENCGAPCDGVFFTRQERSTLRVWNAIWSSLCVTSAAVNILTFLIDRSRFRYPERPIIYLSLCYLAIGLVYLFGSFIGDKVACNKPFPSSPVSNIEMVETVTQGNKKEGCTFLFMSLYFCTIASSVWWIILTVAWFLSAGLQWTAEAIEAYSHYCHLIGWAFPAALTITVLAMGKIEGDVLSGVCYVGFWNQEAIISFVLFPVMTCLIIGFIFFTFGIISLWKIRTFMKMNGERTDKFEKNMLRIVFFSIFYCGSQAVLLFFYYYEQVYLDSWILSWLNDVCQKREYGIPCPPIQDESKLSKPMFAVFLFKYLFIFIGGIASGFWVKSEKTLISWANFCHNLYRKMCCITSDHEEHV